MRHTLTCPRCGHDVHRVGGLYRCVECSWAPDSTIGDRRTRERGVTYTRTDGSPFKLTVADVLARKDAFEMAYNPNDCVELRWAAPDGSDETSTCKRHAPQAQKAKMSDYRAWFRDRRWPAHS